MSKRRVGIVGLDHYHVTGWAESLGLLNDRLDVVALYDADHGMGERLAPTWYDPHLRSTLPESYADLRFFTDLDEMIVNSALDVALVTLSNRDAPSAVKRLAESGVHVLIDKPGAMNAHDAEDAFVFAHQCGVKVGAGFLRRYGRGWRHAKSLVESGQLGELRSAEAVFNTSSPFVRDPENLLFRKQLQGGGILIWLGVHDIDQLMWLTGQRIVEVQAMTGNVNEAPIDVEDFASLSLRFENGSLATLHCAYVLPRTRSEGYTAIRGQELSVNVRFDGTVNVIGPGSLGNPVLEETFSYTNASVPGYGALAPVLIQDLFDAIDEDREPVASGHDLTNALRVVDAAYESAKNGNRIAVNW